jgi:hypothetical protein
VRVKNLKVYSRELISDLLMDSRCLKSCDLYHDLAIDTVVNYASEFSRATRMNLLTDEYHYTTPFFEKDKYIIEIEVNNILRNICIVNYNNLCLCRHPAMCTLFERCQVLQCGHGKETMS